MDGRIVLVTGATNGIGLETARELVQRGARVTIVGRNPDRTAQVASACLLYTSPSPRD